MRIFLLITVWIACLDPSSAVSGVEDFCPDGWSKYGQSCLYVGDHSVDMTTFDNRLHRDPCEQYVLDWSVLAQTESEEENDFLIPLIRERGFDGAWTADRSVPGTTDGDVLLCSVQEPKPQKCLDSSRMTYVCKMRPYQKKCLDDHCYVVMWDVFEKLSLAKDRCSTLGGYLPEINSEAENTFLKDFLREIDYKFGLWLGGTDAEKEGVWKWFSGAAFPDFDDWRAPDLSIFERLFERQRKERTDCMQMHHNPDWHWRDYPCDSRAEVWCEIEG